MRNAAWTLLEAVRARRVGILVTAGENLKEPRQKWGRKEKRPGKSPAFWNVQPGTGAYQLVRTEPLNFSSMNAFTSGVW